LHSDKGEPIANSLPTIYWHFKNLKGQNKLQ